MRKTMISFLGSVLVMTSILQPLPLFADEQNIQVSLPAIHVETTGDLPTSGYLEEVTVTPLNSSNPMPEGSVNGEYRFTQTIDQAKTVIDLPAIAFDRPDEYEYLVRFTGSDGKTTGTYDQSGFIIKVCIYYPDNGTSLKSNVSVRENDLKKGSIQIVNAFGSKKKTNGTHTGVQVQQEASYWMMTAVTASAMLVVLAVGIKKENESEIF